MAAIMFELDRWIKARGDVVVTSQSDVCVAAGRKVFEIKCMQALAISHAQLDLLLWECKGVVQQCGVLHDMETKGMMSVTLGVVGTKLVSSCGSLLPIFKPEKPEVASMLELGMSGCLKVNCATIVYLQQRHATRVFPPAVLLHPCPKL
eukprot:1157517-Pelagomonas_calceolata.AAC.16